MHLASPKPHYRVKQETVNPRAKTMNTIYSSCDAVLPPLVVFLGRRSGKSELVWWSKAEEQAMETHFGEYWGGHRPGRWWRVRGACSILHRCGWRAGDDGGWYGSFCCHERRYRPAQESQQPGIRGQRRGRPGHLGIVLVWEDASKSELWTYQHRHAERNCLSSTDGGHDRLGMQDQLWMSDCARSISRDPMQGMAPRAAFESESEIASIQDASKHQNKLSVGWNSRLGGLATAGLASRFTSSHVERCWIGIRKLNTVWWWSVEVALVRKVWYVSCRWMDGKKRLWGGWGLSSSSASGLMWWPGRRL